MSATIGADIQRVGAHEKVTGATRFGADDARPGLAYGVLVTVTVGKGRIVRIVTTAAERTPGVLLVLTQESMDRLAPPGFIFHGGTGFQSIALMQSDRVFYSPMELIATVSDSIATYPGDFAIALIAFDAMVDVVSQRGSRTVPIAGLHRLPGTTPHVETDLTADELIVRIRVPATPLGRKSLGPKTVAKALMIAKERNA
jgi:xanthine dehydrogenase molybdopterin-binding subunit B